MHKDSAQTKTPGWEGTQEIDERWMQDWVEYGLSQLGVYLGNHARFQAWRLENGR